jgi:Uma2 family endonuclease
MHPQEREAMATVPDRQVLGNPDYPTSDGKPMAETDHHRELMEDLIRMLRDWFLRQPQVYVSGNLLLFYVRGNKRRHISPDVFVVKGVPKGDRLNYILWEEGKAPQFVLELTSSSTRNEEVRRKFLLYQDTLKVKEYFLFDPHEDYLDPQLQGYRLRGGVYQAVRGVQGRLPSQVLDLHLEADGPHLRLFDPAAGHWLLMDAQRIAQAEAGLRQQRQRAEEQRQRADRLAARLRDLGIDPDA